MAINGDSTDEITSYWEGLKAGATVMMESGPATWGSPLCGMKDKFGVIWVLDAQPVS